MLLIDYKQKMGLVFSECIKLSDKNYTASYSAHFFLMGLSLSWWFLLFCSTLYLFFMVTFRVKYRIKNKEGNFYLKVFSIKHIPCSWHTFLKQNKSKKSGKIKEKILCWYFSIIIHKPVGNRTTCMFFIQFMVPPY